MSRIAETIKDYYERGLWNKTRVHNMLIKNIITAEEYFNITGESA